MSFEILFSKQATRFLRKLPKDAYKRVKIKFIQIAKNPLRYLEHYEGHDYDKLRIGDFRALVDVNFNKEILFVRVFEKRSRIYKGKSGNDY